MLVRPEGTVLHLQLDQTEISRLVLVSDLECGDAFEHVEMILNLEPEAISRLYLACKEVAQADEEEGK